MYTVCRQYRHTYLYVHNALLQFQGVNQWNSLQPRMVCSFKKATDGYPWTVWPKPHVYPENEIKVLGIPISHCHKGQSVAGLSKIATIYFLLRDKRGKKATRTGNWHFPWRIMVFRGSNHGKGKAVLLHRSISHVFLTGAKRREWMGMIHWLTSKNHPNPQQAIHSLSTSGFPIVFQTSQGFSQPFGGFAQGPELTQQIWSSRRVAQRWKDPACYQWGFLSTISTGPWLNWYIHFFSLSAWESWKIMDRSIMKNYISLLFFMGHFYQNPILYSIIITLW